MQRAALGIVIRESQTACMHALLQAGAASDPPSACCTACCPPYSQGFDAVLSDMCHFTHGNSVTDAYKSLELARCAWTVATGAALLP